MVWVGGLNKSCNVSCCCCSGGWFVNVGWLIVIYCKGKWSVVGVGGMLYNCYEVYFRLFMIGVVLLIYIVLDVGNGYSLCYVCWEDYVLLVCLV